MIARVAVAILFAAACWALRTHHLNPDGAAFQAKFERAVPIAGVFVTHDEILEFVIHSRFWAWSHEWWGWDVARSYQVLSCAAGGVFLFLLVIYARLVTPGRTVVLVLLTCTGGFVQLFFGDVENYTLTAVCILAYFVAAERYLQAKTSIVWPSICLAIAMMFHLLAGFLAPSLLYLWIVARRRGESARVGIAALSGLAIVAGVFAAAARFWGLPLSVFWTSHAAGHGGHYRDLLAHPSIGHYATQLWLLTLLCPAWLLLAPLFALRAVPPSPRNTHLIVASAFMLLFFFVWFPALGGEDWNLFAAVAIPLGLLAWTNAAAAGRGLSFVTIAMAIVGAAGAVRSLAWIWANHLGTDIQ